jgi:hypothetical protein
MLQYTGEIDEFDPLPEQPANPVVYNIINGWETTSITRTVNVDDLLVCLIFIFVKAGQAEILFFLELIHNFTLQPREDSVAMTICNFEVASTYLQNLT